MANSNVFGRNRDVIFLSILMCSTYSTAVQSQERPLSVVVVIDDFYTVGSAAVVAQSDTVVSVRKGSSFSDKSTSSNYGRSVSSGSSRDSAAAYSAGSASAQRSGSYSGSVSGSSSQSGSAGYAAQDGYGNSASGGYTGSSNSRLSARQSGQASESAAAAYASGSASSSSSAYRSSSASGGTRRNNIQSETHDNSDYRSSGQAVVVSAGGTSIFLGSSLAASQLSARLTSMRISTYEAEVILGSIGSDRGIASTLASSSASLQTALVRARDASIDRLVLGASRVSEFSGPSGQISCSGSLAVQIYDVRSRRAVNSGNYSARGNGRTPEGCASEVAMRLGDMAGPQVGGQLLAGAR